MANFFDDNNDLLYYFDKGIDWGPLVDATERGIKTDETPASTAEAVETYRDMAEMFGLFVADEIAPYSAEMDRHGVKLENGEAVTSPRLEKIMQQIQGLDLHWLCVPRELGGMNCPLLLYFINTEIMSRADVSCMTHHGFHGGMAAAMLMFSISEGSTEFKAGKIVKTRFQKEIGEIGRGEAWATMDITEPDAGSDMAALRAYGEQDDDGNWFVTGQKIFITSGHGKYHFVIARSEKTDGPNSPQAGLGGLSMFLVPTYEDDEHGKRTRIVSLDRAEEKLGHHASPTCTLSFERAPAQLVGRRGEGFKYMLLLMNNARLGVGFEALGLAEAAYRMARDYAAQRPSMGKTIDRHEMVADMLDEMRTDIQAIRALAMHAAYTEELGQKYRLFAEHNPGATEKEIAKAKAEAKRLLRVGRRLTPLLKHFSSEKSVEIARRCLQIHGGNGYMQEYGAEKLLRDALVFPIYEGTSQIQGLMVMKDTLGGIMKAPQRFLRRLAQARWRSLSARDPLERRVAKLQSVALDTQQFLIRKTATDKMRSVSDLPVSKWSKAFFRDWNPKRDFSYAMLHAERLTQLLSDVAICEILLEQAVRHPERAELLTRFLGRAEPRCRFLHDQITTTGTELLARLGQTNVDDAAAAAE